MKPDQVKLTITLVDGSLVVMSFVTKEYNVNGEVNWEREPSKENIDAEIKKAGFNATSWRFITDDDIPKDRTYRNAWIDTGKAIAHNMEKVREIHLARLRDQRVAMLDALDREWMKAMGQGNQQMVVEVEAKRQKLRDMPTEANKLLAQATSVESIKDLSIDKFA